MQTSLERRERRRRNGTRHRGGSSAAKGIAIALPLFLLSTLIALSLVVFVGVMDGYSYYSRDLQDPKALLDNLQFNQQTVLYDRTGSVELARVGSEHRRVLQFADIPSSIIDATTSAEDKTFWQNAGFDPSGMVSALRDALQGRARGASTITQQLVRQRLLPDTSSTADRKIKEIIQSIKLTQEYEGREGKQKILAAYLNENFYGNQSYGVAASAEGYFGVTDLSKLSLAEAATLAAIPQAPTAYDLMANAVEQPDGTLLVPSDTAIAVRRDWVLDRMATDAADGILLGTYSAAEFEAAKSEPIVLHPPATTQNKAPHFDVQVEQQLAQLLCGDPNVADCERIATGGYKVTTSIDMSMQASAEKWVKAYVFGSNQRNYTAMVAYLKTLGITDSWNIGRISQVLGKNVHNGAIIAIDYRTGQVLAYAGSAGFYDKAVKNSRTGKNLFDPQFDVLSSFHQPGSAFKPINYSIGLDDKSLTASTLFMDVGTDFGGGYTPHDADGMERGPVRLRNALQMSLNIPAVKAASINGVDHVLQRATDFGIQWPQGVTPGVSIGIGTVEVKPADLARGYGAIANGGSLMPQTMILSIQDAKGQVVWSAANNNPAPKQSMGAPAAYVMTNILAGNTDTNQNFWWGQYALTDKNGKRRPATLKTGTTDNTTDLLAGGWVAPPPDPKQPAIASVVWAGNSDHSAPAAVMSLEFTAPMWRSFMNEITRNLPNTDFIQPKGVTWANVDAYSGMLPGPYTTKTVREVFVTGTVPRQVDNTKIGLEVDTVSNKLWSDTCLGTKATKGYLDLSRVESNPNWQRYDNIWIASARRGVGARGGPNGSPTSYFYETPGWMPFGATWGAPFAPGATCSAADAPTPSPSPSESAGPGGSGQPSLPPGASPTPRPVPRPTPTPTRKPGH